MLLIFAKPVYVEYTLEVYQMVFVLFRGVEVSKGEYMEKTESTIEYEFLVP
jgi:hypothetical protein